MKKRLLIGRIERVDFPEFNLQNIEAKVDSGAYTSSIHCSDILDDGENLHFKLLDPEHPQYSKVIFKTNDYFTKIVKSSNGIKESRYTIRSKIKMFNKVYTIALTLTERKDMKYPILLGRKFLNKKFIIDTNQKYLQKQKIIIKLENEPSNPLKKS
ncbi:MAG: RimK/LysX family protein [Flavobacteriales bacterium]|nr:RimK/LysX family protein [Flavobacteriales bacterium]